MLSASSAASHKQSGDDAFRSGDFSRACTSYASALEALGDGEGDAATKTSILCNRSIGLLNLQRTAEAVSDAAAAVAASPGAIKPRYRHACALRAHGAIGKALAVCDAALELEPDHMQLLKLAQSCAELLEQAPLFDTGVTAAVPAASPMLRSEVLVPPSAPSAPPTAPPSAPPAPSADEPDPEKDYAGWCRAQGNRLFREAEYGQACAWYGHAIVSLERGEGVGVDAPTADGSPPRGAIATLLSNRAASWLKLGRWAPAAADCERAVTLEPTNIKAYARGSAALMRLGHTERSVAMAQAAVAMAAPPATARPERLDELRALGVRELRALLWNERRAADRRAHEDARAEMGDPAHTRRRGGANAPCLVREQASEALAEAAAAKAAAAGVGRAGESLQGADKDDLVAEIEELERSALADGGSLQLCERALAEATTMAERVREIEAMAKREAWAEVVEHSEWLAKEYAEGPSMASDGPLIAL